MRNVVISRYRPRWLPLQGLPDLSDEGEREGFYQAQLIRELAVRHITSWISVDLEGGPAPPTPENIAAMMERRVRECSRATYMPRRRA